MSSFAVAPAFDRRTISVSGSLARPGQQAARSSGESRAMPGPASGGADTLAQPSSDSQIEISNAAEHDTMVLDHPFESRASWYPCKADARVREVDRRGIIVYKANSRLFF